MSAEKKYTERDLIQHKRYAYERALGEFTQLGKEDRTRAAAAAYPIQKIIRPRVVEDPEDLGEHVWRCICGVLWYRHRLASEGHWVLFGLCGTIHRDSIEWPTVFRVRLWADLFANPNETVEDEG